MLTRIHAGFKDHFLPHDGNGHVPHVLKHRALLGYGLVAVFLKIAIVALPVGLPSSSVFSSALTAENVVILTNETRKNLGLEELKPNNLLSNAAQKKAEDMLTKGYFAHTSPEGLTGFALMRETGYRYRFAGENLAVHYASAEGVTKGWLASPSHKANILHPRFTEIGIGVVNGRYDGYPSTMVVQLFAEPASKDGSPAIATTAQSELDAPPVPAGASIQEVFAFAEPRPQIQVLGITVDDPADDARFAYMIAVLMLLAATALMVLRTYRHHQLPHVLHAILIASLGIGLMKM